MKTLKTLFFAVVITTFVGHEVSSKPINTHTTNEPEEDIGMDNSIEGNLEGKF